MHPYRFFLTVYTLFGCFRKFLQKIYGINGAKKIKRNNSTVDKKKCKKTKVSLNPTVSSIQPVHPVLKSPVVALKSGILSKVKS